MSFAKRLSSQVGRKCQRWSTVPVPRRNLSVFEIFISNRLYSARPAMKWAKVCREDV